MRSEAVPTGAQHINVFAQPYGERLTALGRTASLDYFHEAGGIFGTLNALVEACERRAKCQIEPLLISSNGQCGESGMKGALLRFLTLKRRNSLISQKVCMATVVEITWPIPRSKLGITALFFPSLYSALKGNGKEPLSPHTERLTIGPDLETIYEIVWDDFGDMTASNLRNFT